MARLLGALLAGLLVVTAAHGTAPARSGHGFDSIEAARSDWNATAPPTGGWTPVSLPDVWAPRWPGFDGVVWYRLRWSGDGGAVPQRPLGLLVEYINMAGAAHLNGSLIGRDASLVEPLSRSWNLPRFWVLDAPLLRPGANELLIRVSGLSTYQAGLGTVSLGPPEALRPAYRESLLMRRTLPLLGIGLTLVMGVLYGMLWLLRRSELSYGWFSLFSLLWVFYSYNYVALGSWPFATTEAFQRANHMALLASIACFFMFALHFCEKARARTRRTVLLLAAAGLAALLAMPTALLEPARDITVLLALFTYFASCAIIVRHAFMSRRLEVAVLAACLMLPVAAGLHDTLVFLEWLPGTRYYVTLSSSATLLGISFALTWRMVKGMRLVEHFNAELHQRVDEATQRLADGLKRQHAAELVQTRLTERLSLVRDLHDGLGMTLSSHIHSLGNRAEGDSDDVALWALREVNDDLRLIIESSAFDDTDELADRLVPLRHRSTRLLESAGIECRWQLQRLQGCRLGGKRGLDFLRVLQEALANVLKHSGATRVEVRIDAADGQLRLSIHDNGRGFTADAGSRPTSGMGLQSMRARAARLAGTLEIRSGSSGTLLELQCPIEASVPA
ncbi:sensor histidine kinase [Variovorax saccharolyticus]|uniref:sensor histidine kinase n=1 Tax=Variovorax saccharolyticus TaxID=3053516 RepID=UPI0025768447|nr:MULTISPECIES: 7TM diverse intracellular signaling domain-containing protein [unclassified Variovorax]MDM0016030.1 7TM diverse intracellular signaling domain-containing protein [Variovorax sp. J22R187]MDM0025070.1 7TM diverse intracellular signaling domain-containing protein [Variovorax sp. J31P216]